MDTELLVYDFFEQFCTRIWIQQFWMRMRQHSNGLNGRRGQLIAGLTLNNYSHEPDYDYDVMRNQKMSIKILKKMACSNALECFTIIGDSLIKLLDYWLYSQLHGVSGAVKNMIMLVGLYCDFAHRTFHFSQNLMERTQKRHQKLNDSIKMPLQLFISYSSHFSGINENMGCYQLKRMGCCQRTFGTVFNICTEKYALLNYFYASEF